MVCNTNVGARSCNKAFLHGSWYGNIAMVGMNRSINTPPRGITWLEILVILSLVAILVSLSIPAVSVGISRSPITQTLSNMKQLHLTCQQMTIDHEVDKNPVRWTCSNTAPLTLDQWKMAISPDYLSEADLNKILSLKVDRRFFGTKTLDESLKIFAVTKDDPDDTVLFATKNWHGPKEKELSGEPFGTRAFVVFRKGGDGQVLQQRQITNFSLIGSGGMHDYLPLK